MFKVGQEFSGRRGGLAEKDRSGDLSRAVRHGWEEIHRMR